jgi:hypothetical protein
MMQLRTRAVLPPAKRYKTVALIQTETRAAEEQIRKQIGKAEWIGLPNSRPLSGRSHWHKADWEEYSAELGQTLVGISTHQAGPRLVRDMPRVLTDHIIVFLLPHRPAPTPWAHVRDYLTLRLVCQQWKKCTDRFVALNPGFGGFSMQSILETGVVCLFNCPSDCTGSADYYQKHHERVQWKHYMEDTEKNFEQDIQALCVRIPELVGTVELEYIAHTRFPHPATIRGPFVQQEAPCKLRNLVNEATFPQDPNARARLLAYLLYKYNVPVGVGKQFTQHFLRHSYGQPAMFAVLQAKTAAVLTQMRAKGLMDMCAWHLLDIVEKLAPQTNEVWDEVWVAQLKSIKMHYMENQALKSAGRAKCK